MLQTECPECQQMVWITSDTRFATYHSLANSSKDCPGSRMIVAVPPKQTAASRKRAQAELLAWSHSASAVSATEHQATEHQATEHQADKNHATKHQAA
ncbi:hypothetical protein [Cryobacterium sp. Hh38]|uniref:hypothetical protein n=1 Tax=Cryobacterium sp. Hh38 TaxID=1259156 RepID=UPI00106C785C|nr:hypothetical protein [Cryobacterium sp. Hh38]TFD55995.1 hypothetical protein E3T41_16880 [Cryobacterium sp. Hh38]